MQGQEQTETEAPEPQEQQEPEEKPETETPPEEGEPEAKADAGEEDGAEAAEEGEPDEAEAGEDKEETTAGGTKPKHQRKSGYHRKIERLEREREVLMRQLAANRPAAPAAPAKEKTADQKATEYIESLVDQRLKEREAQAEQQRQAAELQRREQEFRAKHDDYDDALDAFAQSGLSPSHIQALLTSPEAPAIMYQLAKNPDELARIRALPPFDAAREFGRLEAKASATAAPKTPPKSAIRPPAPPTSVGAQKASTRNLEDLPISEYKRAFRSKGG
jgi:hypothetical protein